jgi:5,10-methylenetetrahydrofolate reductase
MNYFWRIWLDAPSEWRYSEMVEGEVLIKYIEKPMPHLVCSNCNQDDIDSIVNRLSWRNVNVIAIQRDQGIP